LVCLHINGHYPPADSLPVPALFLGKTCLKTGLLPGELQQAGERSVVNTC